MARTGRPRKELPADAAGQLETMAGLGLTRKMMALILGVSHDTLERRLSDDEGLLRSLERGEAIAGATVAQCLWDLATGMQLRKEDGQAVTVDGKRVYLKEPNLGAIIWYEKTRGGRSERFKVEAEGSNGASSLPQIPLTTLREAVKAAQKADPRVLKFRRRKEA